MLGVLWLVGWTLRVPVLATPPLATYIAEAFALGESGIAALTMLPIIALAIGAIPAAYVIARMGIRWAISMGMMLMAVASIARGHVPTEFLLFSISIMMGLGIALFQTALPAATQRWTPSHVGFANAVYLNGMMIGELSGAGLTLSIVLPWASGDWRFALVIWSIPIVFIAFLVMFIRLPNTQNAQPNSKATEVSIKKTYQNGMIAVFGNMDYY